MTRTLLRVAAVDDGDDLAEIMRAAEILGGVAPTVETLDPAVEAQLIEVEDSTVTFRHPLVRSAIHQAASVGERHDTHAALAEVLAEDVDRRVWHRAAAAVGMDEVVAGELEEAAGRAQRRGASVLAVAAFERAAALTSKSLHRGSLLLRAATLARDLGRNELAIRLLREAGSTELASEDRALSMWLEDGLVPGVAGDPARVRLLVETAERMNAERNEGLALQLLSAAAFRCFFAEPGDRARRDVLLAADRVQVAPTDPRLLFIQAYAGPIERGAIVIEALAAVSTDADPDLLHLLGTSANVVGAVDRSSSLLAVSAAGERDSTVTLTNSGSTNEAMPSALSLIYDYYEPNTAPCASTAANERTRSHGEAFITTIEQNPSPSFSDLATFIPRAGADSYRVCAYLYTGGDDSVAPEAVGTTVLSIPLTRAQLLARAIKKCTKKTNKARRAKCIKAAKRLYAPKK
jgi:hypothetical protein